MKNIQKWDILINLTKIAEKKSSLYIATQKKRGKYRKKNRTTALKI